MLPEGQWVFTHNLASCADGTAAGAVALAQRAGAAGLLVKWSDGGALYPAGGAQALLAACQAAGLGCSAWGYTYPGDGANVAALIHQWLQLSGDSTFLLDAETEFEVANGAQAAQTLLSAVSLVCKPWYTSLPWPDQQATYPWSVFQSACTAFAPQVYFSDLAGTTGTTPDAWANVCWNRAAIGTAAGGPTYTTGGPQGWQGLSPQLPVIPIFDLSNIQRAAALAQNAGMKSICWWLLDGMTAQQADALAQTPYAKVAPKVTPAPDIAAMKSAVTQIEQGLTAIKTALGG